MRIHSSNTSKFTNLVRGKAVAALALALLITVVALAPSAQAKTYANEHSADVEVFTPRNGDLAGVAGKGFFIDLRARFDGDLASTGASIRTAPPGGAGAAADFPGLVVLLS